MVSIMRLGMIAKMYKNELNFKFYEWYKIMFEETANESNEGIWETKEGNGEREKHTRVHVSDDASHLEEGRGAEERSCVRDGMVEGQ